MEKTNLHYSTKNIPTASRHHYKMQLVDKIEAVIKRMRWKAIFFDNDNGDEQEEEQSFETYGLKTTITPKQVPELIEFEKELISMVPDLKFKRFTNNFQQQLRKDINSMKSSNKLYVPADKTTNMYKVTPQEYDRLLTNSITKTYKKTNNNTKHLINDEGKRIMKDQSIDADESGQPANEAVKERDQCHERDQHRADIHGELHPVACAHRRRQKDILVFALGDLQAG